MKQWIYKRCMCHVDIIRVALVGIQHLTNQNQFYWMIIAVCIVFLAVLKIIKISYSSYSVIQSFNRVHSVPLGFTRIPSMSIARCIFLTLFRRIFYWVKDSLKAAGNQALSDNFDSKKNEECRLFQQVRISLTEAITGRGFDSKNTGNRFVLLPMRLKNIVNLLTVCQFRTGDLVWCSILKLLGIFWSFIERTSSSWWGQVAS